MKFKLGQKVSYGRITRKIKIGEQYLSPDNFTEDEEEKYLKRREIVYLDKIRTGYIAGRRRFVFGTILGMEYNDGFLEDEYDSRPDEWVDIKRQEWGFAYLVAYSMGKTNYVLEEDLKEKN